MAIKINNIFAQSGQLIRYNNSRAAINTLTQSNSVGRNSLSTLLNSNIRPDANLFLSNEAFNNIQSQLTTITTAEESLTRIEILVKRTRELGIKSSDTGLNSADRKDISDELESLKSDITRIAGTININGVHLFENNGVVYPGLSSVNFNSAENSKEALPVIEEALNVVHSSMSQVEALAIQFGEAASIFSANAGNSLSSIFFADNRNIETFFTNGNQGRTVKELEAMVRSQPNNFESVLIGSLVNITG